MAELFDWKKYAVVRAVGANELIRNDIYDITLATCNSGLEINSWKSDWLIEHPSKDLFHIRLTNVSVNIPNDVTEIAQVFHNYTIHQNAFASNFGGSFTFTFHDLTDYSITKWLTAWRNICSNPMTQLTYPMRDTNVHCKIRRYDSARNHIMTYIGFDCRPGIDVPGETTLVSDTEPSESGECELTLNAALAFRVTSPNEPSIGAYW